MIIDNANASSLRSMDKPQKVIDELTSIHASAIDEISQTLSKSDPTQ
jgi:hypothetical protein